MLAEDYVELCNSLLKKGVSREDYNTLVRIGEKISTQESLYEEIDSASTRIGDFIRRMKNQTFYDGIENRVYLGVKVLG